MRLKFDENNVLKYLYVHERIPTDQYKNRPQELRKLTALFNDLTDRNDDPDDLLHYMISQRKQGKWPTLGDQHKKLRSVEFDLLTPEEWVTLDSLYLDANVGSDNYAFDRHLRKQLEMQFAERTKHFVSGRVLAAALESRRKNGLLPTLAPAPSVPFGDIDEVVA